MKNVLFINYGGIGDEILFLPCIQAFKTLYPNSKVILALENRACGIKGLSPLIDEVIKVDIKACGMKKYINILKFIFSVRFMGFDCVISSGKSPFVAIILFLTGIKTKIGYKTKTSFLLEHSVPLNENVYAGEMYFDLIKPLGKVKFELPKIIYDENYPIFNDFILIHPGVSLMSIKKNILKCPDEIFWKDLIRGLLSNGRKVILAGGPDDFQLADKICDEFENNENFYSACGKTKNLFEMAGLIKKSKLLICCDSAPLHIGVSLNANIAVLFGPTNEKKLVPFKQNIKVLTTNSACRPCLWDKRNENCKNSECIKFSASKILDEILNFMKEY